jgi:PPOX class probable F420-dependent enzyme
VPENVGVTIADARYISFTTFRRSGAAVATPVWVAPMPDGRLAFTTRAEAGKVKRLAHTGRVLLSPSDARGKVADGAPTVEGRATVVREGTDYDSGVAALGRKYGIQFRVVHFGSMLRRRLGRGDNAVVVISLSDS